MSDQVKLLNQVRAMRNAPRQGRSSAQQLAEAKFREFVELQADGLERLARESLTIASIARPQVREAAS